MQDGTADKGMPMQGGGSLRSRGAKREYLSAGPASQPDATRGADRILPPWERVFDAVIDAMVLTDCQSRITWANGAASQALSRPWEEIIGKTWSHVTHGMNPSPGDGPLAQAHRTKKHAGGEIYVPGRRVWLEVSVDPVLNDQGEITGAVHILRDVTDRRRREEAMRERQRKYKSLFENAREAILLVDRQGTITTANRLVEEYGLRREDLVGKRLFDFVAENHRARAWADFQVLLGGQPVKGEMDVLTPKGVFRAEYRDSPILRGDRIIGVQIILTDVTAHRQAEEAYRNLVDHSVQGLVIFQEGKAIFANQAMAEMTGYTIDEMLAMSPEQVRNFVHPEDRARVWQNHGRRLAGEPLPEHYEMRGIRKDGSVCWLDIYASRINCQGKPAIQAAYVDITKRQRAEEALRLSEERYRGIFENAMLGMYQTTPEGEILMANPALVRMLGYDTLEELASRNLEKEGFEAEYPRRRFTERLEAEGQVVGLESGWKRRDGSTLWVRESARAIRDGTGKTLCYEGTVEDVTDRKHTDWLTRTLAATALELVELPAEADLFQFVGEKVLALIGQGIVSVNSIEGDTLTVRRITGLSPVARGLAQRLLGRTVAGMSLPGVHEVARNALLTGKLAKVEGGLYELFFRTVPRPVCWMLEKGLGITECLSIGLRRPGTLLGNVTILTQKGTRLNREMIEAFVNQASIALERRKAEQELRERTRLNQVLLDAMPCVALLVRAGTREIVASNEAARAVGAVVGATCFGTWARRATPCPWCLAPQVWATGQARHLVVESEGVVWDAHWLPVADDLYMHYAFDITERNRAEEESRRSERRKSILNRIANVFLTVPDEQMYGEVLAILLETLESRFGVFGFIAENGDLVVPTMTRDVWDACQLPGKSVVFPPTTWGDSLWGRALREQQVFCSHGPFHTPQGHIAIDSFLTAPIVFAGRTIGLFSVANRARGYTKEDEDLLKGTADYFSPILNARLEKDRQEQKRREAEAALRQSEEKYRELFENAREAIVIFNLDKIITDANRFVEEYGFRREDLVGRNYLDFVVESYREKAVQDFELLRQGIPQEGEFEVMTPKGQFVVYYKDCPITRGGQVVSVQSILLDVTERKRAEEALRESEARYRLLADNASDVIWTTDPDSRITYCSPAAARLSGYTPQEIAGRPAVGLLTPASRERVGKILAEELEREKQGTGDPQRSRVVEVEEVRKDGTTHWLEVRAAFLRDAQGGVTGLIGVSRDISERKQAEQQRLEYQALLRELTARLTLAEEQERRRIAVGVHDQIGQRLAITKLMLQSLEASTHETNISLALKAACQEIDHLIEDTHSLTFELSNSVLYEVGFRPAVESWLRQEVQGRYGIACRFAADESAPELQKETCVVLFNIVRELLTNVVKHAKAKHVDVYIRDAGGRLQIIVQDDGIGFEPARTGRPDPRSGGYGLFSIRERLEYLGGSLSIVSAPGEGTCIHVAVPVPSEQNSRGSDTSP